MLKLLTDKETEQLRRKIQSKERIRDEIQNKFKEYEGYIEELKVIVPLLKKYLKKEFEI
jgi:hypothetical protein